VFVNYDAPADVLAPLVPRGTELDTHDGRVFVSLVGFQFLHTRVLGLAIPGHVNFDEVNLRFYVRYRSRGEVRRGVTFVKEVVPRRAIALVARALYNEPYVALPMRSDIRRGGTRGDTHARYAWQLDASWSHLDVQVAGEPALPARDSHAEFITEHYWGYTAQRDGGTIEYRVTHPQWRVWTASAIDVSGDWSRLYGRQFQAILAAPPASALLAEGSSVTVGRPRRIA
jgi:uncharacterized protein YqjF (DUF2071 family)